MFAISSTTEILARAIDVCAARQAVFSANIANSAVDGYRRLEVQFDAQAIAAPASERSSTLGGGGVSGAAVEHRVVATNQAVELDQEIAAMARNALRYQTLLGAYEHSASLLRMAVQEGRGG